MEEKSNIRIDYDKYWPFQLNNPQKNIIAVEKSKLSTIKEEFQKHNGFENIPVHINIEGIILRYNEMENTYTMDETNHLNNVPMSDLVYIDAYAISGGNWGDYFKNK